MAAFYQLHEPKNVVVALSGGMDSSTMLAKAKGIYPEANFRSIFFNYGSKHNRYETIAAAAIAAHYNVPHTEMDLTIVSQVLKSSLLLSGGDIPEGHYEAATMAQTVVPGRNSIFASILAGACESLGGGRIMLAVHAGDHVIYPDCRASYIQAMRTALGHATEWKVYLDAPFILLDKSQIAGIGLSLNVPFEKTRTCYKDQPVACGKCGSCQERLEAFAKNNATDPLEYESRTLLQKT